MIMCFMKRLKMIIIAIGYNNMLPIRKLKKLSSHMRVVYTLIKFSKNVDFSRKNTDIGHLRRKLQGDCFPPPKNSVRKWPSVF